MLCVFIYRIAATMATQEEEDEGEEWEALIAIAQTVINNNLTVIWILMTKKYLESEQLMKAFHPIQEDKEKNSNIRRLCIVSIDIILAFLVIQ